MVEVLIDEWLEEYNSLSESELRSYAMEQDNNNEAVVALFTVFDEHTKYSHLIEKVCRQLFSFYRSREEELQRFALQFIPALVLLYLENVMHGDRQICRNVETLLIVIYNLEIVDKSGQPKVISFRIPAITQASIYHNPTTLSSAFLTESCLRRWEECNTKLVNWGPLPQVEFLNAQNRLRVVTALLFIYNRQLARFPKVSFDYMCKVSSRLVTQGFHSSGSHVRLSVDSDSSHSLSTTPRIPLSSQLMLELLHAVYYALFDTSSGLASQALDDLYNRACYESYTEVLLVANAIKNLLHVSRAGISDGIMSINLAQTTSVPSVSISKSMITNASFRTKKLPDDIPIQVREDTDTNALVAISEEKEEDEKVGQKPSSKLIKEAGSSSALAGVKNFPKTISGLGKKVKESKVNTKNAPLDKTDMTRKSIELEKDSLKYGKDELAAKSEELEFKRIVVSDTEKVSLVSDSIKTSTESYDGMTNGAASDMYNENLQHNAIHVSSV